MITKEVVVQEHCLCLGFFSLIIVFTSNIEQIRGHIEQAIANKQAGNNTLAQAHTLHPIEEVYSSIEPDVSNCTAGQFDIQAQKVNGLLNQTVEQVVPVEARNNATFNPLVIADLLSIAS